MRRKARLRTAVKITLWLLIASLTIIAASAPFMVRRLARLQRVITLFNTDEIVENFRTIGKDFNGRTIKSGPASPLHESPVSLPEQIVIEENSIDVAQWLEQTGTTGFMVMRDDQILFEEYYRGNKRDSQAISWSLAKSFVSALIGIAIEEGHIDSIMDPVSDYVPELKECGYEGVPLKHVLQMSSGVRFNEDYGDFNSDINRLGRAFALNTSFDQFVLTLESERKFGQYNQYISMDTQVLGMVLREATGVSLSKYLEEKIWLPCGMESDARWLTDNRGMEAAFGGLNAVLRDYARFGRLFLNNGEWNGKQVIPQQWVQDSVTPDAPHLLPGENPDSSWVLGYGYQWWIPENPEGDYLAIGVYGQFIYIHPKHEIVIVKTSAYSDYNEDGDEMELQSIKILQELARRI